MLFCGLQLVDFEVVHGTLLTIDYGEPKNFCFLSLSQRIIYVIILFVRVKTNILFVLGVAYLKFWLDLLLFLGIFISLNLASSNMNRFICTGRVLKVSVWDIVSSRANSKFLDYRSDSRENLLVLMALEFIQMGKLAFARQTMLLPAEIKALDRDPGYFEVVSPQMEQHGFLTLVSIAVSRYSSLLYLVMFQLTLITCWVFIS